MKLPKSSHTLVEFSNTSIKDQPLARARIAHNGMTGCYCIASNGPDGLRTVASLRGLKNATTNHRQSPYNISVGKPFRTELNQRPTVRYPTTIVRAVQKIGAQAELGAVYYRYICL